MKTESFRTEGKKPKFDLRQRRSVSLQATHDPTFNCIQCVMFFQCAVSSRNKWKPLHALLIVDQQALTKTVHVFGCMDPLRALTIQHQACLIYKEHTVDVSTGNGYFPGEAASGDSRIQGAKNIFVRGDYRYKVRCEQWKGFEMLS